MLLSHSLDGGMIELTGFLLRQHETSLAPEIDTELG